jgi:hypothetical protein
VKKNINIRSVHSFIHYRTDRRKEKERNVKKEMNKRKCLTKECKIEKGRFKKMMHDVLQKEFKNHIFQACKRTDL